MAGESGSPLNSPQSSQSIRELCLSYPAFFTADLPKRIRLWAAAEGTYPRSFDDPWDEDGWFAQRDPDSTIREDLDELDDGAINYIDNGLLLATCTASRGCGEE